MNIDSQDGVMHATMACCNNHDMTYQWIRGSNEVEVHNLQTQRMEYVYLLLDTTQLGFTTFIDKMHAEYYPFTHVSRVRKVERDSLGCAVHYQNPKAEGL